MKFIFSKDITISDIITLVITVILFLYVVGEKLIEQGIEPSIFMKLYSLNLIIIIFKIFIKNVLKYH